MINWPDILVEDIAKRHCIVYLGSGVSHNSVNDAGVHPMTWKAFLEYGASLSVLSNQQKKEISKNIKKEDFLLSCELLRTFLGEHSFYDLMGRCYRDPQFKSAEIHQHIFSLDTKIVVTPNFDQIYEGYAMRESNNSVITKNYYDNDLANFIRHPQRLILKLHGNINTPNKMIFTQSDYAKARTQYADFYQLLNALIATQTFLFLGAGLNDPDIRLLLENYAFQYQFSSCHFFVIPKKQLSEDEMSIYEKSLNVKFITYSSADNHRELTESLNELVSIVEAKRIKIAGTLGW